MLTTPNEWFASYLASTLSHVFLNVNDPKKSIQASLRSNFLELSNVEIKPICRNLLPHANGTSRTMILSGSMEKLRLSWKLGRSSLIIQNVSLALQGFRLKLTLLHGENTTERRKEQDGQQETLETVEKPSWKEFLDQKVNEILRNLCISIADFEFVLDLPKDDNVGLLKFVIGASSLRLMPCLEQEQKSEKDVVYIEDSQQPQDESSKASSIRGESQAKLEDQPRQELHLESLYCDIADNATEQSASTAGKSTESSNVNDDVVYHLIRPFHYKAYLTHASPRGVFGGLGRGLEFTGEPITDSEVVFCVSQTQVQALRLLIRSFFPPAPPRAGGVLKRLSRISESSKSLLMGTTPEFERVAASNLRTDTISKKQRSLTFKVSLFLVAGLLMFSGFWRFGLLWIFAVILSSAVAIFVVALAALWWFQRQYNKNTLQSLRGSFRRFINPQVYSVFSIPLSPVTMELPNDYRLTIPRAMVTYSLEGHVVDLEMPSLDMTCTSKGDNDSSKSKQRPYVSMSGIIGRIRPGTVFHVSLVDNLCFPDIVESVEPLCDVTIRFVEGSLCVGTRSTVQLRLLNNAKDEESDDQHDGDGETIETRAKKKSALPFPMTVTVESLELSRQGDKIIVYAFRDLLVESRPETHGVFWEVSATDVRNNMLQLSHVHLSGLDDAYRNNVIHRFSFSANHALLQSGYSSIDWSKLNRWIEGKSSKVIHLPHARISSIHLRMMMWNDKTNSVAAAVTKLDVEPFIGDSKTTFSDVTRYYSKTVMQNSPTLISNSEIFGRTFADTVLTAVGPAVLAATPIGPVAGLAAVVAYDATKATINKGKERRNARPDERGRLTDFSEGLVATGVEAAAAGKHQTVTMEGMKAYANAKANETREYAEENRARLGAATIGGTVTVGVSFLASPAIGVPAGIAAAAVTHRAIEMDERRRERAPAEKKED